MANVLSERIAELRKERGLTQEQLGQLVGVSAQAVSKWEKGGAPDVELLPALADRLGVTIDALFDREGGEAVDVEKVVGRWLCAFPPRERFDQLCRFNWSCIKSMLSDMYSIPEIGYLEHAEVFPGSGAFHPLVQVQIYLSGTGAVQIPGFLQAIGEEHQCLFPGKYGTLLIHSHQRCGYHRNQLPGKQLHHYRTDHLVCRLSGDDETDRPVLKGLSLHLEPGKKYALVGGSGSGKSTLLNLLMGAYDSYSGSVSIDGKELREIDHDSLYDLMSLISQNVFLFDGTIRSNITMFRVFPDALVEESVQRSGLSELLARRGEDYRCGENGAGLSGGERQRVSIARCLLRGTPVLLLDEATAALDNQTAFAVTDAILHLDGLTRLVVTHRLDVALMEQYDEIVVLRGGQVREQGTFHQLMEEKGYFYSLFTLAA